MLFEIPNAVLEKREKLFRFFISNVREQITCSPLPVPTISGAGGGEVRAGAGTRAGKTPNMGTFWNIFT